MSASELWSAPREALAVQALRGSGHLRLQVRGESMLPTLWPGDIAEIEACSAGDVGRDDVVLSFREGRFFLHRFLAGDERGFITRGDSMPGPDPVFPTDALLGRLKRIIRHGQPVELQSRSWSRAIGLLLCYSGLGRRAALRIRNGKRRELTAVQLETA